MADRLRIRHGLNRMTDNEMIYDGIRTLINVRVGKGEGGCMAMEPHTVRVFALSY
jgi:hypothetical protein